MGINLSDNFVKQRGIFKQLIKNDNPKNQQVTVFWVTFSGVGHTAN